MVSAFRKKKLLHVYYAFFDTNRSGTIDKIDFDLSLEKIAKLRAYKPGDIIYEMLKEMLEQIWAGLQKEGDKDGDGEISIDEWVSLWDAYARNPGGESDWQKLYCKCIFHLEDASYDGAIDCEEFATVYESFGLDKQESVEAFKKLAQGKEKITWPEFQELWKEYFVSEEPKDPGNYIFGCYICSLNYINNYVTLTTPCNPITENTRRLPMEPNENN